MELLAKALKIAAQAHFGQQDRYGAPYILHPLRVLNRVSTIEEKTVAALHDIIEDTDYTAEDLRREGFPEGIIAAVLAISKNPGEAYNDYIERLSYNPLAIRVKLADLEDNMDIRRCATPGPKTWESLEIYHRAWRRLGGRPPLP